ncbi:unnamed protein product [Dracunculus medinensis]|uniref:AcidPPc domain-containing protein n=1 Tax=Dracunculus medinensis TaxID=318479 RepID=A0A0N4UQ90_DRAME|nr:unnamed protein product [Dracunculus medinensis]
MLLRRITFSGRLCDINDSSNNEKESKQIVKMLIKGFVAVLLDISVALSIAIFAYFEFMRSVAAPYERGFYCYEIKHLNNPFLPHTVSTRHLLAITLALPFFLVILVEGIFFHHFRSSETRILPKYFSAVSHVYLEFILSFTITTFSVEAIKCCFARLRPHYLSVCQPNWDLIDCSSEDKFIESAYCTSLDSHRIRISRQSFPSGHSAAAVHFLLFIYYYLSGMVTASRSALLGRIRMISLFIFIPWSIVVMITRVTDYWHFPTDVIGGILLGILPVHFLLRRRFTNPSHIFNNRLVVLPHGN